MLALAIARFNLLQAEVLCTGAKYASIRDQWRGGALAEHPASAARPRHTTAARSPHQAVAEAGRARVQRVQPACTFIILFYKEKNCKLCFAKQLSCIRHTSPTLYFIVLTSVFCR